MEELEAVESSSTLVAEVARPTGKARKHSNTESERNQKTIPCSTASAVCNFSRFACVAQWWICDTHMQAIYPCPEPIPSVAYQ